MATLICDGCYCTVEDQFIGLHLEKHKRDQEALADLNAQVAMVMEILNPDAATRVAEHMGLEELRTPAETKVEFAPGALTGGP